jgi:branched-chain amino acid transport system substrate-binding protein
LAAIKGMAFESPRGPISIDAEKVEKVNGALYNIEFATYEAVKDPMKPGGK